MKSFKTESKRMLELMINSIYTNKEIFLRELISNSSDALDKLHFISLTKSNLHKKFSIEISADKTARTLTISDNGIGMNKEDLENNLGTIAKSGTHALKNQSVAQAEENNDKSISKTKKKSKASNSSALGELIGQFGVGFYSTFMVAKKVEVVSRRYDASIAYKWISEGLEGYTIKEAEKKSFGTTIQLTLKDKDEDFDYDDLFKEDFIASLVSKHSNYIRYPITMNGKTLNSMTPIWKKAKAAIKQVDYEEFYKNNYRDFNPPLKTISANLEGIVNYNLLVFVPQKAPHDYHVKDIEKGLTLYSNSVLIMQNCSELLPNYFAFVRGLIDSGDLSLNISREILQQDRQLRAIAVSLEKKLLSEFSKMLEFERETYEKFFDEFGMSFKFGAYDNFGVNKDKLQDLILFKSSNNDKYITFSEYLNRMKEGQESIYYAVGANIESAKRIPQTKTIIGKGYEVLYLVNPVDEFLVKSMMEYEGKKFLSVSAKDALPDSTEEKEQIKKATEEHSDMLTEIKNLLKDKVKDVVFSVALGDFVSSLRTDGSISLEMEKILASMPGASPVNVPKVLEFNPTHSLIEKLKLYFKKDKESFNQLALLLFEQAQMLSGIALKDNIAFVELVNRLLVK